MRSVIFALLLTIGSVSAHAEDQTLFDEIGGGAILRATVAEFVDIMLEDERVNFAFAGADLAAFKLKFFTQLCVIAEGPCHYQGRDMKTAHQKLDITTAQFNAVAEDLYKAFDRVGVPYRAQNKLMARLAPMHGEIVKK